MKKAVAVLLCVLMLLTAVGFAAMAEDPADAQDEGVVETTKDPHFYDPTVEQFVKNTAGKYIPTGKALSDAFFKMIDNIKGVLDNLAVFFKNLEERFQALAKPFDQLFARSN